MFAVCEKTYPYLFRSSLIGDRGRVGSCLVGEEVMASGCDETVVEFIECKEISVSAWLAQAWESGLRRDWLANGN